MTGIEIGPDYCALVGARRLQGVAELKAVRVLGSAEWPPDHRARTERLRAIRSTSAFPRDCVVVLWEDAAARVAPPALQAVSEAGFRIRHVSSPVDALAALARLTPRPPGAQAAAWLALNTNGAAIVVVLNGVVLYSRTFTWAITAPEERRQAHLLRRYLRVAQVVPELRRAIREVSESHGVTVETAITCGNLPDLRSLTMPLINQTDIEVETLDSTIGLEFGDRTEELLQVAAAIRLAAAAAVTQPVEGRAGGLRRAAVVAAAAVLAASAVLWVYSQRSKPQPVESPQPGPAGAAVSLRPGPGDVPEIASSRGSTPPPAPADQPAESPAPVGPRPAAGRPLGEAAATSGRMGGQASAARRQPASDPLPTVEGILIAPERRLAVVDGTVVGVGDSVGSRRVVRIDADAVILRDSAGRDVRVPVRPKSPRL